MSEPIPMVVKYAGMIDDWNSTKVEKCFSKEFAKKEVATRAAGLFMIFVAASDFVVYLLKLVVNSVTRLGLWIGRKIINSKNDTKDDAFPLLKLLELVGKLFIIFLSTLLLAWSVPSLHLRVFKVVEIDNVMILAEFSPRPSGHPNQDESTRQAMAY